MGRRRQSFDQTLNAIDYRRCKQRVFFLGVRERRLTILSQQHRALHLARALDRTGLLPSGDKAHICVIGAGVGGLTLAAALGTLNRRVTLLERALGPLHLQESNDTRWLHPNVYRWPMENWDQEASDLPFLNWHAGMAGKVARSLVTQWETMRVEDDLASVVTEHYGVSHVNVPKQQ